MCTSSLSIEHHYMQWQHDAVSQVSHSPTQDIQQNDDVQQENSTNIVFY